MCVYGYVGVLCMLVACVGVFEVSEVCEGCVCVVSLCVCLCVRSVCLCEVCVNVFVTCVREIYGK